MNKIKVGTVITIIDASKTSAGVKNGDSLVVTILDEPDFTAEFLDGSDYWHFQSEDEGKIFKLANEIKQEIPMTIINNTINVSNPSEIAKAIAKETPARIDGHYDSFYELTEFEAKFLQVKIDPYFIAKQWRVGERDPSGVLFHILKTIARFGDKNPKEREIKAIYLQIKRLAELEGVDLE